MIQDTMTVKEIAGMIDHTLLHPTMTDAEIEAGILLGRRCEVAAICVKPYSVATTKRLLNGSDVAVCVVIGFPHGTSTTTIKVAEAEQVIRDGAAEVDMVVNTGKALGGDWDYVRAEIAAINAAVVGGGAILKVIFETDFLGDAEIIRLCEICSEVGTAFVKTSTGFGFVKDADGYNDYQGATDHVIGLMRKHCAPEVKIKASGKVRTLDRLLKVRELGASRVGATATVALLDAARERGFE